MNDDIYTRTPINKAAALVVGQSGCNENDSLEYQRDSLARALERTQREISGLPKNHKYRKELGVKKLDMQVEISLINKKLKLKNIRDRDLDKYIIEECKRIMTTSKWNEIMCRARALKEDTIRSYESKINEQASPNEQYSG